jgi:DNA-binding response OmpR family regulator
MNGKILIVEDDRFVLGLLGALLESEGFSVAQVATGKDALALLTEERFDLVLLDLGLPDEDGMVLLRRIRTKSDIPIIVLTSRLNVEDRIQALEIGADDFIAKPADHREISLRISKLIRRGAEGRRDDAGAGAQICVGSMRLDTEARALTLADGRQVDLTKSEFDLLAAFFNAPNRVLSRDVLLDAINRGDDGPMDRSIDVLISRIRKKIEKQPRKPEHILTVPGVGYRLVGARR